MTSNKSSKNVSLSNLSVGGAHLSRKPTRLMTNGSLSHHVINDSQPAPYYVSDLNRASQELQVEPLLSFHRDLLSRASTTSTLLAKKKHSTSQREPETKTVFASNDNSSEDKSGRSRFMANVSSGRLAAPSAKNRRPKRFDEPTSVDLYVDLLNLSDEECSICPSTTAATMSRQQQPDILSDLDDEIFTSESAIRRSTRDNRRSFSSKGTKEMELGRRHTANSSAYGSMADFGELPTKARLSPAHSESCLVTIAAEVHAMPANDMPIPTANSERRLHQFLPPRNLNQVINQTGSGPIGLTQIPVRQPTTGSLMSLMTATTSSGVATLSPNVPRRTNLSISNVSSSSNCSDGGFGSLSHNHSRQSSSGKLSSVSGSSLLQPNFAMPTLDRNIQAAALKEIEPLFPLGSTAPCPDFIGREWLFKELYDVLVRPNPTSANSTTSCRGALISGASGTGKSAFAQQLVSKSLFASSVTPPLTSRISPPRAIITNGSATLQKQHQRHQSVAKIDETISILPLPDRDASLKPRPPMVAPKSPALYANYGCYGNSAKPSHSNAAAASWSKLLAQQIVAYHFCQIDNFESCALPEFVCQLGRQLASSTHLRGYREALLGNGHVRSLLSKSACLSDPLASFRKAIVEPLKLARAEGKIPADQIFVILIDGLDGAEYHRVELGISIGGFVGKHFTELPANFKCILTTRSMPADQPGPKFNFAQHLVNLDNIANDDRLRFDVADFISQRLVKCPSIQANIIPTQTSHTSGSQLNRFIEHLVNLSKGNILYVKLVLSLIERNCLVIKTASFKVLPVTLSEVLLLQFSIKFVSAFAWDRCMPMLTLLLASVKSLTPEEIYDAVRTANQIGETMKWEEFKERMASITEFLSQKPDGSLTLAHQALREWLTKRDPSESQKFLCDLRLGHALVALGLCRQHAKLDDHQLFELSHHILKAHLFKNSATAVSMATNRSPLSQQLTAAIASEVRHFWSSRLAPGDFDAALCNARNLYCPNLKISRLLLISGASANARVTDPARTPILAIAAGRGQHDFVNLLLEFNAQPGLASVDGTTPLMMAAKAGQLDLVQLFHQNGVSQTDSSGKTALCYAAENGHVPIVSFLLHCDWSEEIASAHGDQSGIETMTSSSHVSPETNSCRQAASQRAFVLAAGAGHTQTCEFFLEFTDDVNLSEPEPVCADTALGMACLNGHKETISFLLAKNALISYGNSSVTTPPLIQAVRSGHWDIVSALLAKGSLDVNCERGPIDHVTPLMVAAKFGHTGVMELLLSRGADVNLADSNGQSALFYAVQANSIPCINLLLQRNAQFDLANSQGRKLIHVAAVSACETVVKVLLNHGIGIDEMDRSGMRPLEIAIASQNYEALVCFLRNGAKLSSATWALAEQQPGVELLLLNKLLEDANLLYKKGKLKDAAERFKYALKKFPKDNTPSTAEELAMFNNVKHNLLVNQARCQKRSGDLQGAIDSLTDAITSVCPTSPEAHFVRAVCYKDLGHIALAIKDASTVLKLAPSNRDARQLLSSLNDLSKAMSLRGSASAPLNQKFPPAKPLPSNGYHGDERKSLTLNVEAASELPLLSHADEYSSTDSGAGGLDSAADDQNSLRREI